MLRKHLVYARQNRNGSVSLRRWVAQRRPSNRRFRRLRILIVGCGDVGQRFAALLNMHAYAVTALTSQPERRQVLREQGIRPLLGNLDNAASLKRLRGIALHLVHLAPPAATCSTEVTDTRSRNLHRALAGMDLARMVYASTSGVYGDCEGQWVSESRALNPLTARAKRRVDAEQRWRKASAFRASVLRIPGIYGAGRSGGALERIKAGVPVLHGDEDVYTNRIHADDLARAVLRTLFLGRVGRVVHVAEPSLHKWGDYLEQLAEKHGLPKPPRQSRAEMVAQLSPMQMSFLSESRRLQTTRMTKELRLKLHHSLDHSAL